MLALTLFTCEKKHAAAGKNFVGETNAVNPKQTQPKGNELEIPVLCYHNFTETKNTDITVSKIRFEQQVKSLADSGYHSILPDDLYAWLTTGKTLPSKPIMFSFDDSRKAQYTIAQPILRKYGFTAVFLIMTVCVNKPDYLSSDEIKELMREGNSIQAHTYDHPPISQVKGTAWAKQLEEPKLFLEKITGRPVEYFAYPYGGWTKDAISELKHYGYKAAFQLSERESGYDPLFTIRRLMVEGIWTANALHRQIAKAFPNTVPMPSKAHPLKAV